MVHKDTTIRPGGVTSYDSLRINSDESAAGYFRSHFPVFFFFLKSVQGNKELLVAKAGAPESLENYCSVEASQSNGLCTHGQPAVEMRLINSGRFLPPRSSKKTTAKLSALKT